MRTFKANQFPHFSFSSLTDEIYRSVWLLADCTSGCETNYVLSDEMFIKIGK